MVEPLEKNDKLNISTADLDDGLMTFGVVKKGF